MADPHNPANYNYPPNAGPTNQFPGSVGQRPPMAGYPGPPAKGNQPGYGQPPRPGFPPGGMPPTSYPGPPGVGGYRPPQGAQNMGPTPPPAGPYMPGQQPQRPPGTRPPLLNGVNGTPSGSPLTVGGARPPSQTNGPVGGPSSSSSTAPPPQFGAPPSSMTSTAGGGAMFGAPPPVFSGGSPQYGRPSPVPTSAGQVGPPPTSMGQQPPFGAPPTSMGQRPPFGAPPPTSMGQQPPMSRPPIPGQQFPPRMGPPLPGQQPGMQPPPTSMGQFSRPPAPPTSSYNPQQPGSRPPGPPVSMYSGRGLPPPSVTSPPPPAEGSARPTELPVPFGGQAQYSHQLHTGDATGLTPGITPNSSESPSQRSSRAPSPVPTQAYDTLEGQFPNTPVSPASSGAPVFPGAQQQGTPPGGQDMNRSGGGICGKRVYPQMQQAPPPPNGQQQPPPPPSSSQQYNNQFPQHQQPPSSQPGPYPAGAGSYPQPGGGGGYQSQQPPYNATPLRDNAGINAQFRDMSIRSDPARPVNLLQEKGLIPPGGVEPTRPELPHDYKKVNASPEVFRCTLNAIPNTQSLLNKARLPLGLLIHPFKDLAQLPVIQSSVIVRCRSCRTYINPFVSFVDMRRWKCNLCYRVNELPEEFNYDPVSKTYGEPQRRPEIKSSTIEFIAPSEYMLRPPQPAVYLYVLDVSFNARETGYLNVLCQTILDELDRIPGDARTQIGFITFDSSLHFYNLSEDLSRPQMLVVSDVDEVFLPVPEGLLCNLSESKELLVDLLSQLPEMFEDNMDTGSALGPALQAAYKLMSATGGRITVMQTQLPTVGPGGLKNREDPNERAGKKISNLGPATDFYKKLALDCSAQQIAVDLFMLNAQYADIATIAGVSKYSGGEVHSFPSLHTLTNKLETERYENVLRRYITRKIGFEAVMRIRCTRGLSIHTFHGNFFVRSTDLLSLPNINPEAGFGMQMSIEDTLEGNYACAQAALLYTSSKGERRIRVHTLCMPVTSSINEIYQFADQQAIVGLISKMAVDKSLSQSMSDARDALVNAAIDMIQAFGSTLTQSQRMGQLPTPWTLRLMPLYMLALLKSMAFRVGASTKLDDRVIALESFKTLPLGVLLKFIYPDLYPVHALDDQNALSKGELTVPQPPLLQLSSANMDRHGAYLMDRGCQMILWIGAAVPDMWCQEVLQAANFQAVPEGMMELPELETLASERLRTFIGYLNDLRAYPAPLQIIREDSRARGCFLQHLVEDRTESTFSYYEFLQHLQKEVRL